MGKQDINCKYSEFCSSAFLIGTFNEIARALKCLEGSACYYSCHIKPVWFNHFWFEWPHRGKSSQPLVSFREYEERKLPVLCTINSWNLDLFGWLCFSEFLSALSWRLQACDLMEMISTCAFVVACFTFLHCVCVCFVNTSCYRNA